MFRIDVLPAEYGDALWIEYGPAAGIRRVLIDCGTKMVFEQALRPKIEALDPKDRHFELFVVSHVDLDHIGGAIDLLDAAPTLGLTFGDVWFNGHRQIEAASTLLGPLQGEDLTARLLSQRLPWNVAFDGGPVMVADDGPLPEVTLEGGLRLTLLSPDARRLAAMRGEWVKACAAAGIVPGEGRPPKQRAGRRRGTMLGAPPVDQWAQARFTSDRAKPNGSSIAMLVEYDGARLLLAADAFAPLLSASLARLPGAADGPLALEAFKLSHHGSRNNTSIELVRAVRCRNWIVSSNGKMFEHPDREAIARVVTHGGPQAVLLFNYRSEFNELWADAALAERWHYRAVFPERDGQGLSIALA